MSSGRLSIDTITNSRAKKSARNNHNQKQNSKLHKKEETPLEVPVYLQEIERICFPESSTPIGKNVTLDINSKLHLVESS